VKQYERLSIRTTLEEARTHDAVKMEEVVDKKKIEALVKQGLLIGGVSELRYIQVSLAKQSEV
jgi:hypothetical protein